MLKVTIIDTETDVICFEADFKKEDLKITQDRDMWLCRSEKFKENCEIVPDSENRVSITGTYQDHDAKSLFEKIKFLYPIIEKWKKIDEVK